MSAKVTGVLFVILLIIIIAVGWSNSASIGRLNTALESNMAAITELEENQQVLMDAIMAPEDEIAAFEEEIATARERIQELMQEAEEALTPPEPELDEMPPPVEPGM